MHAFIGQTWEPRTRRTLPQPTLALRHLLYGTGEPDTRYRIQQVRKQPLAIGVCDRQTARLHSAAIRRALDDRCVQSVLSIATITMLELPDDAQNRLGLVCPHPRADGSRGRIDPRIWVQR